MAYTVETNPAFTHDVTVMRPVDGGHRADTFRVRFVVQPAEMVERYQLLAGGKDLREFLDQTVIGLEDIVDEKGDPVPYSDALKQAVLGDYSACLGMIDTYIRAVTKAKSGN